MFLRLFPRGSRQTNPAVARPAIAQPADPAPTRKVIAGHAARARFHFRDRALKNNFAAPLAGSRADFDDLVRRPQHRFLMLDDDHRVAAIAQSDDGRDQAIDIRRMQADRRLIEHVQHVDQAGAERGGQRHPLRLSAAERAQRAVEREIAEPDGFQIAEPGLHLLEHHAADAPLPRRQLHGAQVLEQIVNFEHRKFSHVQSAQARGQRLGSQPTSAAGGAGRVTAPAT